MRPFKTFLFSFFLTFLYIYSPARADDEPPLFRTEWNLDESYTGPHQTEYNQLRWKIPGLIRQTTINIAVRTGLDFKEGWRYPLTVGFVDGSPMGVENVLAYTQLYTQDGKFAQRLNINMDAYVQQGFDFDKVFAHELTHAMVNDSIEAQAAMVLPIWFHEGLAVMAADQGDAMVKSYAHRFYGFADQQLLNGLDSPHTALDYAEDYLAFKFLWERHGSSAFHNFIKEVIKRKGDIPGALQYTCNISWNDFQKEVKAYSSDLIKNIGPPHRGDDDSKPY